MSRIYRARGAWAVGLARLRTESNGREAVSDVLSLT